MTAEFDKLDNHYHLQLSALMDGALAPDQARFLLRRLQHDEELTGCWERWQLLGDVLRGQAQAPAPADFAGRVALMVASEPALAAAGASVANAAIGRNRLARWGGGALAASLALVALFMARQQLADDGVPAPVPSVATQSPGQTPDVTEAGATLAEASTAASAGTEAAASLAAATVAVASVPRRQDSASRGSATRNQQAARSAAARVAREPIRAVAAVSEPLPPANAAAAPIAVQRVDKPSAATPLDTPQARPWPRSALPQYSAGGFNAGLSSGQSGQTFYPFEPRLPASPPVALPESDAQD
ncbi:sigma-E factor negative regulatory protein [Pseudoxanthomonas wuyuanensis]|uniref:sigma-E factor negative regulatory protein n=1 Tax=Pseudoxanthomonas wuyuanensis TaxID=1073196 RepID=UPI001389B2FA|nr:sigma-E factor negative regulatory protein [Pseudoxanthomonas wuyuanensis]KAF1721324.1 hypothetical protein CSC75_07905 [Pseudoxanthomonas wuyuanensis]